MHQYLISRRMRPLSLSVERLLRGEPCMYAIIAAGGKQHKVAVGEVVEIEKLEADVGSEVEFDQVLMVSDGEKNIKIGTPLIEGAKVIGEVVEHGRGDKVTIIKFRRRKHHMKKQGHRQYFTGVKIKEIKH